MTQNKCQVLELASDLELLLLSVPWETSEEDRQTCQTLPNAQNICLMIEEAGKRASKQKQTRRNKASRTSVVGKIRYKLQMIKSDHGKE